MGLFKKDTNLEMLAAIGDTEKDAMTRLVELLPFDVGQYNIKTQELADTRYLATCQYEAKPDEKVAKTGTGSYRSPLARDE